LFLYLGENMSSFLKYLGVRQNSKPELIVLKFDNTAHVNGTNAGMSGEGKNLVSAITQNGTGDYTVTFRRTGRRAYRVVGAVSEADGFVKIAADTEGVSSIRFQTMGHAGALANAKCTITVMGFFSKTQR
jgi:hypothetical protein